MLKMLDEGSSDKEEDASLYTGFWKEFNSIGPAMPNVIYVPPEAVDGISDDEQGIDEDDMMTQVHPGMEIAGKSNLNPIPCWPPSYFTSSTGEVEIEYENGRDDFAAPPVEEIEEPQPVQPTVYKKLKDFGFPKWKRTKRGKFAFDGPSENGMEGTRKGIAEQLATKTPYELFCCFFDDRVVQHLVDQTNKYAAQNNKNWSVAKHEMLRFIGILIFSGYHTVPRWDLYWSVLPDFGVKMVNRSLSRNRFRDIKRYFHLADNDNLDTTDRFSKVRPLLDMLNERYLQWGIFATHLSIDEQMVPYFGRHSCKMYIRGKPIRFGFKYWCLCSSDGYLFQFMPYGGASVPHNKAIGLGASVILDLLRHVENPERHTVQFDNFFSSYYLFCLLSERGFRGTGTIRKNRMGGADEKLKGGRSLKKHDHDYMFDETNKILVTRWQDNAEVTIVTNHVPLEPLAMARRYDQKEKKKISIPMPNVMAHYNKYMGGVDLHDNGVANYRVAIKGKKWWWPLWVNAINSTIVNAWKVHIMVCKIQNVNPLPQLDFKAEIARKLIFTEAPVDSSSDEQDNSDNEDTPRNLPNLKVAHHVVAKNPAPKPRQRCKMCGSQTVYICSKCNASLHPKKCFAKYHEKK